MRWSKPTLVIVIVAVLGFMGWVGIAYWGRLVQPAPTAPPLAADPNDAAQVTAGQAIYAANCASCHGARMQGQPNWKERKPDGKLPAPPHDATGHTWHHPDRQIFDITKMGIAVIMPGYRSDMPGFAKSLSDHDIWNVIAYIKSTWPTEIQEKQSEINRAAIAQGSGGGAN
jgi:mono/diheme cytochrome c family protein